MCVCLCLLVCCHACMYVCMFPCILAYMPACMYVFMFVNKIKAVKMLSFARNCRCNVLFNTSRDLRQALQALRSFNCCLAAH